MLGISPEPYLAIFAVIKKNVAAITPLGDFDMRPQECPRSFVFDQCITRGVFNFDRMHRNKVICIF